MRLSLIVAMASNRVIGVNNQLPWRLSADLQNFRKLTMGKPILMGRKTFESIGRPLPGRHNIIITRNAQYRQPDCSVYTSLDSALEDLSHHQEVMVIGGESFYRTLLPRARRLYVTLIHKAFEGDTYFPEIDPAQWREVDRMDIDDDSRVEFSYTFLTLSRL